MRDSVWRDWRGLALPPSRRSQFVLIPSQHLLTMGGKQKHKDNRSSPKKGHGKPFDKYSNSTKRNHSQGEEYDVFAGENGHEKIEQMTLDMVQSNDGEYIKKRLSEYSHYLINRKKHNTNKSEKSEYLKPGTAQQYLSNAKNAISIKLKHKATFLLKDHPDAKWYKELYDQIYIRACVKAIKRGDPIKSATLSIRHKLLNKIAEQLVKRGDAAAYEDRAVVVTLYHAVGRGGEVSHTYFEGMHWSEEDEALWTSWPEEKTGHNGDISFHANAKGEYLTDWIHSMGCYIITSAGRLGSVNKDPDDPSWLFPSYTNLADGGASSKASRILKSLHKEGSVKGLLAQHASHGIRGGASDDMATNKTCHIVNMICRGGWDWTGECQIFGYLTRRFHVLEAGRALAGMDDCRKHLPAPTLDAFITSENQSAVDKFAFVLFLHGPESLQPGEHLLPFRNAMVASLLMNFEQMEKELGHNDAVVCVLTSASAQCGIKLGDLRKWGSAVRSKFEKDILKSTQSSGTELDQAHCMIGILEDQLEQQGEMNRQLAQEVGTLRSLIYTLQSTMDCLVQSLTQGSDSTGSSPKRKKPRSNNPPSGEGDTDAMEVTPTAVVPGGTSFFGPHVNAPENVSPASSQMAGGNTAPGTTRNVNNMLRFGPRVEKPAPFDNTSLPACPVGSFLVKLSCERIDIVNRTPKSLGVRKQVKDKGKKAFELAMSLATNEEKEILKSLPVNPTNPKYQQYYGTLKHAASAVTEKLYKYLKEEHARQFPEGKPSFNSMSDLTVTKVYNLTLKLKI